MLWNHHFEREEPNDDKENYYNDRAKEKYYERKYGQQKPKRSRDND